MGEIAAIARNKLRIVRHSLEALRKHSRLKIAVVMAFALGYWAGAYFLFRGAFRFMERFLPGLGDILVNRLFYLFFLATFIMLVFSNVILVYSVIYKSREVDFLAAMPVRHSTIFKWKFGEALFFSSWASIFMAGPLLLAYGIERSAALSYYFSVPLFLLPFFLIAAGIGGCVMVLLVRFFPGRKLLAGIALAVVVAAALVLLREPSSGSQADVVESPLPVLDDMVRFARLSRGELLPSTWLVTGILLEPKAYPVGISRARDKLLSLGMLWSNGLMAVLVCFFLGGRFFYSGWSRSRSLGRRRSVLWRNDVVGRLSFLWRFLRPPMRAMVTKDLRVFWRDPTQWGQFVIFFGLLGVYIVNLRNLSYHEFPPFFKNLISFMNLAATALTLGTLSTRFVFPQMSLEGNKFWIVGLAPLPVEKILLEKFLLCLVVSTILAVGLTLMSGLMLGLDATTILLSSAAMLLICFGLSGLSVGLGALFPNFTSDNPARIVSGFGGTLALVLILAHITIVLAAEMFISHANLAGHVKVPAVRWTCIALGGAAVCLSILAGTLPMTLGARRLRRTEF